MLAQRGMLKKIGAFFSQKGKNDDQLLKGLEAKEEEAKSSALTEKHMKFQKSMFSSLMKIAEVIMSQLFEKVSVIPYSIRQFCKLLYQKAMEKFVPKKELNFEKGVALVSHFLLRNWLLRACF